MKKVMNTICVISGFICFALGAIGIVLPVLPTTPFLLLAAALFAKGSDRFHKWFVGTNLYRKYIGQAVKKKTMGRKEKRRMLITLGIIFVLGIIFSPVFAKVIIAVVGAFHFYYFGFRVKTAEMETEEPAGAEEPEETV